MVLTRSSVIPSMTRWVAKVQPTALGPRTVSASSRFIMRTVAQWRFPPATALPTRLNAHQVTFSSFPVVQSQINTYSSMQFLIPMAAPLATTASQLTSLMPSHSLDAKPAACPIAHLSSRPAQLPRMTRAALGEMVICRLHTLKSICSKIIIDFI